MKSKMLLLMMIVAALALAACGSDEEESTGSRAAGSGVDRAFVADMIPHHESAVEMAGIAQERGDSEFVKTLATDIIRTQDAEIETMEAEDAELAEAGIEPGDLGVPAHMMGMDMDVASLQTAEPFDQAFLQMMIPHHEGAVTMAEAEIDRGSDPELRALAEDIIAGQEREIAAMRAELGAPAPPGAGGEDAAHGGGHGG